MIASAGRLIYLLTWRIEVTNDEGMRSPSIMALGYSNDCHVLIMGPVVDHLYLTPINISSKFATDETSTACGH